MTTPRVVGGTNTQSNDRLRSHQAFLYSGSTTAMGHYVELYIATHIQLFGKTPQNVLQPEVDGLSAAAEFRSRPDSTVTTVKPRGGPSDSGPG